MQHIQLLLIIFLLLTFLAGMYCTVYLIPISTETMSNEKEEQTNSCPDLLIQKGTTILLYNTKQKLIPGVNPMPFYNLDEYINYLEIQKKNGIDCPILLLQQETTTQGNEVYRVRPSPFELEGGLDTGKKFFNSIQMLSLSANLGDSRSIVTHPASTTHAKLSPEARLEAGITDGLIRVSVGLEHIADIIKDVSQAIEKATL